LEEAPRQKKTKKKKKRSKDEGRESRSRSRSRSGEESKQHCSSRNMADSPRKFHLSRNPRVFQHDSLPGVQLLERQIPMGFNNNPLLQAINGLTATVKDMQEARKKEERKPLRCPTDLKNKRNERAIKIFLMIQELTSRKVPHEVLAELLGELARGYTEYDTHADYVRLDASIINSIEDLLPEYNKDMARMLRMSPAAKKPSRRPTSTLSWDRQDGPQFLRAPSSYGQLPESRAAIDQQIALELQLNQLRMRRAAEYFPAKDVRNKYEEQQGPCVRDFKPPTRALMPASVGKLTVVHDGQVNAHGHCTFCTNAGRPNPTQCHYLKRHPSAASTWCAST
jgi:hypothetical protein